MHQVSIGYSMTIKTNHFTRGNTAWRRGLLLQEDGTFYVQCPTSKCMENPTGRNCSPGVWLLFPASPLMSIHTTGVCIIHSTKKRLEPGFPTVSLGTRPPPLLEKKILERKLLVSDFRGGHWIYILHGRSCVPVILTALPKARCVSRHIPVS